MRRGVVARPAGRARDAVRHRPPRSPAHNLLGLLGDQGPARSTRPYSIDRTLHLPGRDGRCGQSVVHPKDRLTLLNPTLLIEVLSPDTEAYDRGAKFHHFEAIESLLEYILVATSEHASSTTVACAALRPALSRMMGRKPCKDEDCRRAAWRTCLLAPVRRGKDRRAARATAVPNRAAALGTNRPTVRKHAQSRGRSVRPRLMRCRSDGRTGRRMDRPCSSEP